MLLEMAFTAKICIMPLSQAMGEPVSEREISRNPLLGGLSGANAVIYSHR
ncbi:hypothetical protein CE91St28_14970 [Pyramidobacter piscolens]|nr:hypothetical protein CE91St28_14970 [Pyramidobacter piscolens]